MAECLIRNSLNSLHHILWCGIDTSTLIKSWDGFCLDTTEPVLTGDPLQADWGDTDHLCLSLLLLHPLDCSEYPPLYYFSSFYLSYSYKRNLVKIAMLTKEGQRND